MKRIDLRDWLTVHKCKFEPLKDSTTGNSIKVIGPYGQHVFLDTPFDEKPVKPYMVCKICDQLGIETPDICKEYIELQKIIKEKYYPKK